MAEYHALISSWNDKKHIQYDLNNLQLEIYETEQGAINNLAPALEVVKVYVGVKPLNEIKAQAIEEVLEQCNPWSCMGTYAITVDDLCEYANKLRGEE